MIARTRGDDKFALYIPPDWLHAVYTLQGGYLGGFSLSTYETRIIETTISTLHAWKRYTEVGVMGVGEDEDGASENREMAREAVYHDLIEAVKNAALALQRVNTGGCKVQNEVQDLATQLWECVREGQLGIPRKTMQIIKGECKAV
jgi:hypothetical protein